jgi:hypothetical protein
VAVGVAGCRDHPDPGQDLGLAVQHLVGRAGEVDQRRDGVAGLVGGRTEAAVEQQQPVRVGHQVGADHDPAAGQRVARRPGVVPQQDPPDVVLGERHAGQSRFRLATPATMTT